MLGWACRSQRSPSSSTPPCSPREGAGADGAAVSSTRVSSLDARVSASYVMLFVLSARSWRRRHRPALQDFALVDDRHTAGARQKSPSFVQPVRHGIRHAGPTSWSTGRWTIPRMNRTCFRPHFAAAVEATASTGGQIMPPVMGPRRSSWRSFLAVPYAQVALCGGNPGVAVLHRVFFAVHFEAKRQACRRAPTSCRGSGAYS